MFFNYSCLIIHLRNMCIYMLYYPYISLYKLYIYMLHYISYVYLFYILFFFRNQHIKSLCVLVRFTIYVYLLFNITSSLVINIYTVYVYLLFYFILVYLSLCLPNSPYNTLFNRFVYVYF